MGDDADDPEPGMYAVTESGLTVECANFEAIDEGVLLFEDAKRKRVCGFVPYAELRYVLPADATTREGESAWEAMASGTDSDDDGFRSELTLLGGLGETYARRLHEDGIDSLAAIRRADAERVAAAAGVAESRAERWITAANRRDAGASSEGRGAAQASAEDEDLRREGDAGDEAGTDGEAGPNDESGIGGESDGT